VRLGGVLYRVVGWRKETNSGESWLSLALQPDERIEKAQEPRVKDPPPELNRNKLAPGASDKPF
jgi:hypothetical protein